jgi:hypothetical protein
MAMTTSQRQWMKLTKKITKLEMEIIRIKAERLRLKPAVMSDMRLWGLRDEAITQQICTV